MFDIYDAKILIVDDEKELREILQKYLYKEGFFNIFLAENASNALDVVKDLSPHIIILDIMLPDESGFSLFQKIRHFTNAPVLFLSALDEDTSRLRGLGLGADDYMTKPFLPKEVLLRMINILRRTYSIEAKKERNIITLGNIKIDMESGVISGKEKETTLTAKEFAILDKLNDNLGKIVTIDSLCDAVWKDGNIGYENTLMVHIRRLRSKIEENPSNPKYLITMRGLGYKLISGDKI